MATSFLLAENPKWYFSDLTGKPMGGGTMYTYRSLNKTQQKFVFLDPAGNLPWTDPILIDENGTQGPFYFADDEAYYIEVYDAEGVLQWTIDGFTPPTGGGSPPVTEGLNFTNLVVNNVFWRNIEQTSNPIASTNVLLAPGAHSALMTTNSTNAQTNQSEIRFIKSNTAATDQITFTPFTIGTNSLTGDITPPVYLRYVCSVSGAGETYKYVQFPISSDLQSTSNQDCTVTIWARCNSGNNLLSLYFYQYFGDVASGAASNPVQTLIQTLTLTTAWQKFILPVTVPSISTKTYGSVQNTGLFLQVQYPLSATTSIDFTKPSMYISPFEPDFDYLTNDQIDSVINTPRTGDVRTSINSFVPFGWVAANDGTIGGPSSNASNRANYDTFSLYDLIWNQVSTVNLTLAPIFDSAGNASTLGSTSAADFSANKQIALTKALGQVLAGTVPSSTIPTAQTYTVNTGVSTSILNVTNTITLGAPTGTPVVLTNSGGAAPTGLTVGTIYYAIYVTNTTMRLAATLDDAIAGTFLTFSTNGSGTNSIQVYNDVLSTFQGQKSHLLTIGEMPSHNHSVGVPVGTGVSTNTAGNNGNVNTGTVSFNTGTTGGSGYHNIMQPTTFMNVFIKL